jgi:hypothetical protein
VLPCDILAAVDFLGVGRLLAPERRLLLPR